MSVFESLNETSNKAVDVGERFYRKSRAFYKLKIFQQLALTTGLFCKMALVGSVAFLGLVLFIIALTIYLGQMLDSTILACLLVGLLMFIISAIIYALRKQIDNFVVRKLSNKFFD